ncbi:MAG: SAM-dependent methyltransferase [Bacteroidetes bacterium SW_9_63_38]|nr:MAG: SAM-dependent methyltransferase [Bacteroidetes bacterium SW_9_63_38]
MPVSNLRCATAALLALLMCIVSAPVQAQDSVPSSTDDTTKGAPYVSTPQHVVLRMLELAEVTPDDVVYDLGSGDGRFVISAARDFGARGVGIEIEKDLVAQSRRNAARMEVEEQVRFYRGDLFKTDLSKATVVTLYLWPGMMDRLRPKPRSELVPGARIISHDFTIDGWTPDTTVTIGTKTLQEEKTQIHLWTIPE